MTDICRSLANLAVAASVALAGLAACTAEKPKPDGGTPKASTTTPSAVSDEISQYLQAVNVANVATESTKVRAPARPSIADTTGQSLHTMTIRDEDARSWQAGRYRLVVYCTGKGELKATVQIGTQMASGNVPCSLTAGLGYAELTIEAPASPMIIVVQPADKTIAGIGYQVQQTM